MAKSGTSKKIKIRKKTLPDKIPKRYFVITDCIFNQQIHILLNHTPKQYEQWLNRKKVKDIAEKNYGDFAGFTSSLENEKGRTEWIIFVADFQWTIKNMGTLIHEITHAIIRIWQHNNIPYNADTQEFLAHSISNLYEDIARKLLVFVKWSRFVNRASAK